MAFSGKTADIRSRRAALYLRVSTGRQAAGDVSIPSQRDMTVRYCESQGWEVTAEYVEPGASATDDRRPVFQRMLEDVRSPGRNFDIIVVHAFSRFYRNGAEMELTIRRLRKAGVEVVSITQPTGDDPSQTLMRQIIGIFDEYTSRENGKNVSRAMRESARQGFWNGAPPPLGYKIVEAEKRGSKIKKKLAVDPVEAETIRLIFRLYAEGVDGAAPLGVKDTAKWLNAHGYRTRKGAAFGVGPIHAILTNPAYSLGKCRYGVFNSRSGEPHDPANIVEIDVPTIVPLPVFEAVQAKLARNHPRMTAPRIVNGPILLTGLAVCATCGAGMTRTGTKRGQRSYTYYSCGGCHQKGPTVCRGRHVPLAKLDELILTNVKDTLLVPERLEGILHAVIERRSGRAAEVEGRRRALQAQIDQIGDKLARLYRAIEDGIVELDDDLKARVQTLKDEREIARAALDRIADQGANSTDITAERIASFAALMRDKLDAGDIQTRKSYLRAIISRIEVDDHVVRIIGAKAALVDVIAGRQTHTGNVRGFIRKWRAMKDSKPSFASLLLSFPDVGEIARDQTPPTDFDP
jgi:site-specific DNA recombinase